MLSYLNALEFFKKHVILQKESIIGELQPAVSLMNRKVIHSHEVVADGTKVVDKLGFNDSFKELSRITFLDHDIGRFKQARYTSTFDDTKLVDYGYKDHGDLGRVVLQTGLLHQQIPDTRTFDEVISTVVNDHVTKIVDGKDLLVLCSDLLKSEDAFEFFSKADPETKRKVTDTITQIVQDVDRLDIYHQILDGRWTPNKCDTPVDPKVFDMFYQGKYLNIAELKKKGLWNHNVGELVRLSFINQIKLLSVAEIIKEENILARLKEKRNNPYVLDAFDVTMQKLDEKINNSDGVTIR